MKILNNRSRKVWKNRGLKKIERQRNFRRDGFTLVELIVTIAVVIILSVVSVPIYNANIDKAKISEGYALIGMIKSAQERYYSEYGNFLHSQHSSSEYWTANEVVLGVDARNNKYYTNFFVGLGDKTVGFKAVAERRANSGCTYVVLIYNLSLGNTIYTSTSWQ